MVEISRTLNWRTLCDWGKDGSFLGTYDDISNRIDIVPGITWTRGRDPSRSFGEPRIPALQCVGLNDDRFFSNDFPGSPIYQQVTTARLFNLQALAGESVDANAAIDANSPIYANGTAELDAFTGYLDRMTHQARYEDRRVTLRALGSFVKLKDRKRLSTPLYSGITTGQAFGYLLDALGWTAGKRRISGTAVVLAYWWLAREDPYGAAIQLLRTEGPGAAMYEDADGTLVFEGQDYRSDNARCLTAQASFFPTTDGIPFANPEHEDGEDTIINVPNYRVKVRAIQAVQAIWTYTPTLTLAGSTTRFFNIMTSDPFQSLVTPLLAATDYVISSGTLTAATVVQQDATLAVLTMTAGAGGVTLTGLQVRAQPVSVIEEYDVGSTIDTTASQLAHGIHSKDMTGRSEIDKNVAIAICDTTVQRYSEPRAANRFAIIGTNGEYMRQILTRQISDRIAYRELQTGQDHDAWIESIEYRAGPGMLTAVVSCERTAAQGYARWDSAVWGTGVWGQ